MRVCVIGTGYVGLVTGVCLAYIGHQVVCVDNQEEKVKMLQTGKVPIYEPGLEELMQISTQNKRLSFTTNLQAGVEFGEFLFIAVGTPALPTGESDTRYVEAVAKGIGSHLRPSQGYKVIINKSTVPLGSGEWVRSLVEAEVKKHLLPTDAPQVNFDVVSNPEFLREGSAIYDTLNPDRIVLGGNTRAVERVKQLYEALASRQFAEDPQAPPVPFVITDLASAEMIKYASNSFLATKISFINEIANICDRVGADVTQVARGVGLDSRIGSKFLQAGLGWGGSCFPKDIAALVHTALDYGYEPQLLQATVEVNQQQRRVVVEKLQQSLQILKGKRIGLLGLTFKPDTDDLRDTPALDLIQQLTRLGAEVRAYDPIISAQEQPAHLGSALIVDNPEELAAGADALVLVTDWQEFKGLNFARLARLMRHPLLLDGRNALDPDQVQRAGMTYIGIGRSTRSDTEAMVPLTNPKFLLAA